VSGLTDGTYTFQVKAIRTGYVESGYQSGTCVVTVTTVGAPGSIDGVPATSTTGSFTVSWPASSTGGVTYKLERSTNDGVSYTQVYSGTALSYAVSNLANGSYLFRVKATLTGSVDSTYATSGPCVVLLTVATPASITVPATDLDGAFTVSWGASATASVTYVLERSDNGGAFAEVYRGTARTLAVSGLANGSYAFQVKAVRTGYVDSGFQSGTCLVSP
jgi:predicted phage tail protein